jgi:hypothetical protein
MSRSFPMAEAGYRPADSGERYPRPVLAAAPAWLSDNLTPIALATLAVLTFAVLRMVQKTVLRITLLALIALVALVAYVNRAPLEACARTCSCNLGGRTVSVPLCDDELRAR